MSTKPAKPRPDFPLFAHASGSWAKKIDGRTVYFGPWNDPDGALLKFEASRAGEASKLPAVAIGDKPAKPSPDFPLYAASNGQWCKKIRGRKLYFGLWSDPAAALAKWEEQKDDLLAGRPPAVPTTSLTVAGLCNHFLNFKKARIKSSELKQRTYDDYKDVVDVILATFGQGRAVEDLKPDDFETLRGRFAQTHGPVALLNDITRARVVFKYGADQFRILPYYGKSFDKPSKAVLREDRNSKPKKLFAAAEILKLIKAAKPTMKAMVYLGINCAFGNSDCAMLELRHLDLENGWHSFPRPKTGIDRRSPLWPETVAALREVIRLRPHSKNPAHASRVFLTAKGGSWERTPKIGNPVSKEFAKLKSGQGFYSLRHTFQTIGDSSGHSSATSFIMGHAPSNDDMGARYREQTFEDQLLFVSDFVRSWLRSEVRDPEQNQGSEQELDGEQVPRLRLYVSETTEELPPSRGNEAV